MKYKMMNFLILFGLIIGFSHDVMAQAKCEDLFSIVGGDSAYERRNTKLAEKYPKFKTMLSDPQKYFNDITARFEAQKRITPENPYAFDFSDWAQPLFTEMHSLLVTKRADLAREYEKMNSGSFKQYWNGKKRGQVEIGLQFFDQLLTEIETHQSNGFVSYRDTFELSYFYSRASGLFDVSVFKLLNTTQRLAVKIDEYTEGYEQLSATQEFDRYLQRKVVLFDKKSPISTWEAASDPFQKAFFNKDKLELLVLPTTEFLGRDIFIHLMSSEIYLVGVTTMPVAADGYRRPGGLFFAHDLRHSSFMYYRNMLYRQQHGLTRSQIDELSRMMSEYVEQFEAELKAMEDRSLVSAIRYYSFNQHHEGGYHFSPINYQQNNAFHAPFILYAQMKMAGQKSHGLSSAKDIFRARKWVESFWLKRVSEENHLIQMFQKENAHNQK
jgi:hypothetical protein